MSYKIQLMSAVILDGVMSATKLQSMYVLAMRVLSGGIGPILGITGTILTIISVGIILDIVHSGILPTIGILHFLGMVDIMASVIIVHLGIIAHTGIIEIIIITMAIVITMVTMEVEILLIMQPDVDHYQIIVQITQQADQHLL